MSPLPYVSHLNFSYTQKTENSDSNVEAPGKVTEKHDVPTSGGPDFFER